MRNDIADGPSSLDHKAGFSGQPRGLDTRIEAINSQGRKHSYTLRIFATPKVAQNQGDGSKIFRYRVGFICDW
jgi:hypothetical protein